MDRDAGDRAFRQWLADSTSLSSRAVGDVVSRLRRLRKMIEVDDVGSEIDLTVRLLRSEQFRECSPSVRSQLKRAGRYYLNFASEAAIR